MRKWVFVFMKKGQWVREPTSIAVGVSDSKPLFGVAAEAVRINVD